MSAHAPATLSDAAFVDAFRAGAIDPTAFHHADHVRLAWLFVRADGMPGALTTFPAALRRFADTHGASGLYHETITWAFLLAVHDRQARHPAETWTAFAETHRDLLSWRPSLLDRLYTPETLASPLARRTFLLPDR